ncbi:hypothetical protein DPX16_2240 [Anabarilius grahami]|uniref:Uncharacterized protein n=1 Tax=Anabarilius grahami TaxID=495550 RepID=A0A3N0YRR3_ANAGA|nr:hypothetical protein DPX16_2240 [Anabarilius grahami]
MVAVKVAKLEFSHYTPRKNHTGKRKWKKRGEGRSELPSQRGNQSLMLLVSVVDYLLQILLLLPGVPSSLGLTPRRRRCPRGNTGPLALSPILESGQARTSCLSGPRIGSERYAGLKRC